MILQLQILPDQVGKAAQAFRKEFYLGGREGEWSRSRPR